MSGKDITERKKVDDKPQGFQDRARLKQEQDLSMRSEKSTSFKRKTSSYLASTYKQDFMLSCRISSKS